MTGLSTWLAVAACGAVGAYARYSVSAAVAARWPGAFPWGTFSANLTGSFALGLLVGAGVGGDALLVLGSGLLGAYTTFSTWMVESKRLADEAQWLRMWLNLLGSMLAGLTATGFAWLLAERLS